MDYFVRMSLVSVQVVGQGRIEVYVNDAGSVSEIKEKVAESVNKPFVLYWKGEQIVDDRLEGMNSKFDFLVCCPPKPNAKQSSTGNGLQNGYEQLKSMGFSAQAASAALEATQHNTEAALAHLLGEDATKQHEIDATLQLLTHQHPALLQSHIEQLSPRTCQHFIGSSVEFLHQLNNTTQEQNEDIADTAAISRLVEMGIDPVTAQQVYVACDRNEHVAASILFT